MTRFFEIVAGRTIELQRKIIVVEVIFKHLCPNSQTPYIKSFAYLDLHQSALRSRQKTQLDGIQSLYYHATHLSELYARAHTAPALAYVSTLTSIQVSFVRTQPHTSHFQTL